MHILRFVFERACERFEITEVCGEGCYVFRYVDAENTHDFLQDDVPMAQRCALDEWGVETSKWREAFPGELPLWQQGSSGPTDVS